MSLRSPGTASESAARRLALLGAVLVAAPFALAQEEEEPLPLSEYVVSVARMPQETNELPIVVRLIDKDALAAAPTIDAALREDPAFSLFRRNTSLSANPTAQGVSLRGVGPSGASRTAVVLDDMPLNDPFGGWITWGQIPSLSLAGAEIAHGGGSSIWGSNALGGTVALASTPWTAPAGAASLQAGSDGWWRGEVTHTARLGGESLRVDARGERYGGFHALRSADRGAVDRPLDHRHWLGQLAWRHPLSTDVDGTITMRGFDESRGNGTELQENTTRLAHLSLALEGRDGGNPLWKAGAWLQRQDYSSFFTAVSEDRMSETPANDQYSVPATAAGFQAHRLFLAEQASTVIGVDGRWVEGETRELYLFRDGEFAQRRQTGGVQLAGGWFLHHDRTVTDRWHLSGAVRIDGWANRDGHTIETTRATGAVTRDETYRDDQGLTASPRLGASYRLSPDTLLRAAAYRAFRLPTLNEYYRPFRVGNTTTLANPELDLELLHGVDLSIEHRAGDVRLAAGVFWNSLDQAVGNVTLSANPAGTTRQRRNIDDIRITGVEVSVAWMPSPQFELRAAALVVDAEVTSAPDQPTLEGRQLAQVPEYAITSSIMWRAREATRLQGFVRATGRQFEDDGNLLPLASACVFGLRLEQRVGQANSFLEVTDLFNDPAQTSRSFAGLTTYDQPRSVRGGLSFAW